MAENGNSTSRLGSVGLQEGQTRLCHQQCGEPQCRACSGCCRAWRSPSRQAACCTQCCAFWMASLTSFGVMRSAFAASPGLSLVCPKQSLQTALLTFLNGSDCA